MENSILNIEKKFHCEYCNFVTSKNSDFIRHLNTKKHCKIVTSTSSENTDKKIDKFICICGKEYKYRQSLYLHKKIGCSNVNSHSKEETPKLTNFIIEIIKNNPHVQKELSEYFANSSENK
jgi:hypothetical protein